MRPAAFAIPGDIMTPTGGYIYERRLLEALRTQGRDVRHLSFGGSFPDPTPTHMADAIKQLNALESDRAVILDGFVSATLDTAALATLKIPTVAVVHHPLALETGLDEDRREYLYKTERANLSHIDHVIVPSPTTAKSLTKDYGVDPAKITIARPGTDRPTARRAPTKPPLILSVGIQHPRKGHDILLRALSRITSLEWTAVIAGKAYDMNYAEHLGHLIRDLKLDARVTLAGHVSDAQLSRLYAQASVFALATRYEGYGLVIDEALAHGLPIVSCAAGAVVDTVPDGAGLLVAPDDDRSFANALAELLQDGDRYRQCADAATKAGELLPDWADTADTVGEVLDKIRTG